MLASSPSSKAKGLLKKLPWFLVLRATEQFRKTNRVAFFPLLSWHSSSIRVTKGIILWAIMPGVHVYLWAVPVGAATQCKQYGWMVLQQRQLALTGGEVGRGGTE